MRRDLACLITSVIGAACACSHAVHPAPAASVALNDADRVRACAAPPGPPAREPVALSTAEPPDGVRIAKLAIEGARNVPAALIRQALAMREGMVFDAEAADADLLRLLQLGAFSDARVLTERGRDGLAVIVQVTERPLIRRVYLAPGSDEPRRSEWTPVLEGDPYDPVVAQRKLHVLQQTLQAEGFLDADAHQGAVRVGSDQVDLCLHVARGPEWRIGSLRFPGASVVSEQQLLAEIDTHGGKVNTPGEHYRADFLEHDVLKMNVLHWEQGLAHAKLGPPVVTRSEAAHRLDIELRVDEGPVFHVGEVRVRGAKGALRKACEAIVAPLRGTRFARSRLVETRDKLHELHCKPSATPACDVTPSTSFRDQDAAVDVDFVLEGP